MPTKVSFITLVALVCYVDGKRTEIPPGKPVPESLSEVEINELLESRSIERSDAADMERRQEQLAAGRAQAEFEAERERLIAAREANARVSAEAEASKGGDGTSAPPPAPTPNPTPAPTSAPAETKGGAKK